MKNPWSDSAVKEIIEKYYEAVSKLILLDFDGTLVDFASNPAEVIPSRGLTNLLQKIAEIAGNRIIIITGRRKDDISGFVGHLPVDIVAEHGALIRENGLWKTLLKGGLQWKNKVYPLVKKFTSTSPNSFIEEKGVSLAWHYRDVETEVGTINARSLIEALKEPASKYHLKIIDGNKVIEIISKSVSKGAALDYLLSKERYDYILSAGDDKTDEDMFEALLNNDKAFTIKIGGGNTSARYKLQDVKSVIMLLEQLAVNLE